MRLGKKKKRKSNEMVDVQEGPAQKSLLEVETKLLHYTRTLGNYNIGTRPKQIGCT